jgi:hypothetical protein
VWPQALDAFQVCRLRAQRPAQAAKSVEQCLRKLQHALVVQASAQ